MKKAILAVSAAALLTAAPSAQEPAPDAAPDYDIQVTYGVSLLGLSVGSMQLDIKFANGTYEAHAFVQPEGLASTFTSNTVNAVANGTGRLGEMQPFSSWIQQVSTKRTQTVSIQYKDGEPAQVEAVPVYEQRPEEKPTPEQIAGTYDPLGGVVAMMLMPGAGPGDKACGTTIPIYDGKRAYAFDMWSGGEQQVTRGAGGYNGPTLYCVAGYRRIAGWDAEHVRKASDTKIHVNFAPIGKGANGGPAFYLPVRMWSDAEVGDVVAIPSKVTINGKDWAQFFADGG